MPKISLACRCYDRTEPIIERLIQPRGMDLVATPIHNARELFTRVFRGEFDVGEFSLAELTFYTSRNKCDLVGIPVFPSKMFRHGFIFCRTSSDLSRPEDLKGKKIGSEGWAVTASVWLRGILADEYDVTAANSHRYTVSAHHWEDNGADEIRPPDGSKIHWIRGKEQQTIDVMESALMDGRVDAIVGPRPPASFLNGDNKIKRLIENYQEVEQAYFKRTGIYPIMHVLAARRSVVERYPDLPAQLFETFVRAKKLGQQKSGESGTERVWPGITSEQEREFFGGDPWTYGLKANERVIDKFLDYCHDQGVSQRRMVPRDLFATGTWDLNE